VTSHTPGFDPFLLHIGLTALRTHEHTLDVMDLPDFFHTRLQLRILRISQVSARLQDGRNLYDGAGHQRSLTAIMSVSTMPPG
jgi:hypothetical protein